MIFHKWKLLFIGIPKCASVSIFMALSNKTDDFNHRHGTISEEFSNNDEDLLLDYRSFCVVRNPYDRFYSAWKHNHPHPGPISIEFFRKSFNDFVDKIGKPGNIGSDISHEHYWPQYKFVTLNKRIVVDEVLRFENLNQDWADFQDKWNRSRTVPYKMAINLNHENSSAIHTPWKEVYNSNSIEIIRDLYHLDFDIFQYETKFT